MVSTSSLVIKILPEAIEQVSDGGKFVFSMRGLYYAVRQIFLTKFFVCPGVTRGILHEVCEAKVKLKEPPDLYICEKGHEVRGDDLEPLHKGIKFYKKYDSFTQDFLRKWEKAHGKIEGMYREERGSYIYPSDRYSPSNPKPVGGRDFSFIRGVGNKVIAVEKGGIFGVLTENKFHLRLDGVVMSTIGFTTEAGREMMIEAEENYEGVKVTVLHDYDINGLLIASTLAKETKRLDIHVSEVVDLGLTWEIVDKLMRERGLIPEPVELTKNDVAKVEGMNERGEIGPEEYNFLLNKTTERYQAWKKGEKVGDKEIIGRGYRIELNALRPSELLEWLEKRLEELDLWKTVPEQEELDEKMRETMQEQLEETENSIVNELTEWVEEEMGLKEIWETLISVRVRIKKRLEDEVSERMEDLEYPKKTVEAFKDEMKKNMEMYWTVLAEELASHMSEDVAEPLREKVEGEQDDIVTDTREDYSVKEAEADLQNTMKSYLGVV